MKNIETLTIIVNSPPYGDEHTWNALRLASASLSSSIGMSINIFLLGDAVNAAKIGQKPPLGYYNIEKMLSDLLKAGAKIAACGTCLASRALVKEEMIEGIEVGSMIKLAGWIKESNKVLSF